MIIELLTHYAALAGAGLVAGFLAGLLGIGGGIVTIPVLFTLFTAMAVPEAWRMHMAIATSLVIIVFTNFMAARAHHRRGGVDWSVVRRWWWLLALAAVGGSLFAKGLKTEELIYFFAGLASLLAIKMLLPLDRYHFTAKPAEGLRGRITPIVIGFVSSIMGIGGGSFVVPYLSMHGVRIQTAVGTSSVTGLALSLAGGVGYVATGASVQGLPAASVGFVHLPSVLILAVATSLTAGLGVKAAHKLSRRTLSAIFGGFLLIAVVRLLSLV